MMKQRLFLPVKGLLLGGLLGLTSLSVTAAPVAMVEDVNSATAKVQLLDFLEPGTEIDLGTEGELILGYMNSCVQEQIKGGQVTVGENESNINKGSIVRNTTPCDGGRLALAANQAVHSGAVAMRDIAKDPQPTLTVHDVSPLLILPKAGKLTIKRIDSKGEKRFKKRIKPNDSERYSVDLAKEEKQLTPGATYMISIGGLAKVVKIAEDATHGKVSMMGRLIPL